MEITVRIGDLLREKADLAVLATYEGAPLPKEVVDLLEPKDFSGI